MAFVRTIVGMAMAIVVHNSIILDSNVVSRYSWDGIPKQMIPESNRRLLSISWFNVSGI